MINVRRIRYLLSCYTDLNNQPHRLCDLMTLREWQLERDRPRFQDRRLIFCIHSGRVGSGFVAQLLNMADNVTACHEPRPKMNGSFLRMVEHVPTSRTNRQRRIKIAAINRSLAVMPADHAYVETNHMFIKTFADVVLDYYANVQVMILRRGVDQVLKSCIELGWFSNRNPVWKLWMSLPRPGTALIEPIQPPHELDAIDCCIAYLLEVEAQAKKFVDDHPEIQCHEVTLEQLTTPSGARQLFEALGIAWPDEAENLLDRHVNPRQTRKRTIGHGVSLDHCRKRIESYLARAREMGRTIPSINW